MSDPFSAWSIFKKCRRFFERSSNLPGVGARKREVGVGDFDDPVAPIPTLSRQRFLMSSKLINLALFSNRFNS
jgi:hypothetical protein